MRKLRTAISCLFILSVVVFGAYMIKVLATEDRTAPVISSESDEITVSVEDDKSVLMQGLTAEDNKDGDLTDSIRVSSMSHFISDYKRTISYVVFDGANLAGTYERTVQYTDYTPPRIYMKEPLRYTASEVEKADFTSELTVKDCLDGDLTTEIRTFSDTYFYNIAPGEYPVTFQVNNSAGDICAVPVDVVIVDSSDANESSKYYPMLSNYIIYTTVDKKVGMKKYVIGLEQNNIEYLYEADPELESSTLGRIKFSTEVDYSKPGVYPVDCSYTSSDGVKAVTKAYIVVEGAKDGK